MTRRAAILAGAVVLIVAFAGYRWHAARVARPHTFRSVSPPPPALMPTPYPGHGVRVTARFSPRGGCPELVAWHVDASRSSVFVASYQWSSRPVHDAVLYARSRGIRVRLILDPGMETSASSLLPELVKAGLTESELRIDDKHAIFHDKVILRDAEDARHAAHENGSYNYSRAGDELNAENAQVVEGAPAATAAYLADLERHWAHARPAKVKPTTGGTGQH